MFQDSPLFSVLSFGVAAYIFYLWLSDYLYFKKNGVSKRNAFEGATSVPFKLCIVAVFAALGLLTIHVFSEIFLGVERVQTSVAGWAILSWTSAAVVEEVIFRGYLVVQNRGIVWLVASSVVFSLLFAAGHPFLWDYSVPENASIWGGVWKWHIGLQPMLSTLSIFECSLLFYFLRFISVNKNRSLIPCMLAHLSYNLGVFAAKFMQGFIV